jgi:hypothetical protein
MEGYDFGQIEVDNKQLRGACEEVGVKTVGRKNVKLMELFMKAVNDKLDADDIPAERAGTVFSQTVLDVYNDISGQMDGEVEDPEFVEPEAEVVAETETEGEAEVEAEVAPAPAARRRAPAKKAEEKAETSKKVEKAKKEEPPKEEAAKSCYGHREGTKAGRMDELILQGTTRKDMVASLVKEFKLTEAVAESSIRTHVKYLSQKKGFTMIVVMEANAGDDFICGNDNYGVFPRGDNEEAA